MARHANEESLPVITKDESEMLVAWFDRQLVKMVDELGISDREFCRRANVVQTKHYSRVIKKMATTSCPSMYA